MQLGRNCRSMMPGRFWPGGRRLASTRTSGGGRGRDGGTARPWNQAACLRLRLPLDALLAQASLRLRSELAFFLADGFSVTPRRRFPRREAAARTSGLITLLMAKAIPQWPAEIKAGNWVLTSDNNIGMVTRIMNVGQLIKSQIQAGSKAKRQGRALTENPWNDSQWGNDSRNIQRLKQAWETGWKQQQTLDEATRHE